MGITSSLNVGREAPSSRDLWNLVINDLTFTYPRGTHNGMHMGESADVTAELHEDRRICSNGSSGSNVPGSGADSQPRTLQRNFLDLVLLLVLSSIDSFNGAKKFAKDGRSPFLSP